MNDNLTPALAKLTSLVATRPKIFREFMTYLYVSAVCAGEAATFPYDAKQTYKKIKSLNEFITLLDTLKTLFPKWDFEKRAERFLDCRRLNHERD